MIPTKHRAINQRVGRRVASYLGLATLLSLGACQKSQDTFNNGRSEKKPATKGPTLEASAKAPEPVLTYDYGFSVALKSGLTICKDGRVSIALKSDISFDVQGVKDLRCVSAKLDLNRLLKPMLEAISQLSGQTKIGAETKDNMIFLKDFPNSSDVKFNPPVPTFFLPTLGGDNTKFQGISRQYDTAVHFTPNDTGVTEVKGKSTFTMIDVDKPITTADGKTFNKSVHWRLQTDWDKRGVVPYLSLFDMHLSTAPLDVIGMTLEITINPSYLPLYRQVLKSELLRSAEELSKLADIGVNLTLVINITR